MEAKDEKLSLLATDLEVGLRSSCAASIAKAGSVTIPAKKLYEIHRYFMKLMSKDIAIKKPLFIFVDASKYKQTPVFSVSHLNYLSLFLKTPEFKSIWKSYHYFGVWPLFYTLRW